MIHLIPPLKEGHKGTCLGQHRLPNKSGSIFCGVFIVFPYAGHVFTLTTYYWLAGTGLQVILPDMDRRAVDVDEAQMVYRAGHFAQMTTAALSGMYPNLHPAL
jgi:hypothetical protein